MLVKERRIALPAIAAFSFGAIFLSGCSAAETADPVKDSPAPEPSGSAVGDPSTSAVPVSPPETDGRTLVSRLEDPDGGELAVHGLRTDSEAVTFAANCGRPGTITVEVAKAGPVTFTCGDPGASTSATMDVRAAAGQLDVAVIGAEGVAWAVTITEAELSDSMRNYPSSVSSPSSES